MILTNCAACAAPLERLAKQCSRCKTKEFVAEAEEDKLGDKVWNESWRRWYVCSLCEHEYHGVVRCALSWACWKTYLGRICVGALRRVRAR